MKNHTLIFLLCFLLSTSVLAQKTVDPIWGAIATKNLSMLKDAIKNGGDVNGKDEFIFTRMTPSYLTLEKATPLFYAIQHDWYDGVLELLRAGAKPNAEAKVAKATLYNVQGCPVKEFENDITSIFLALNVNDLDVIKLLIIAGADTRGMYTVKFANNCKAYGGKAGMVYLRDMATDQAKEILKAGKKASWASNGLPAEGQRPL